MKEVVTKKDASKARKVGIATSILGWLGTIASAASTMVTNQPIYLYSIGAASTFIALAGIGLTLYANRKHGHEKKMVEMTARNIPKIRIAEHKFDNIVNHPEFWRVVDKLEQLQDSDDIFYMTIDKVDPEKIVVKSWIEHSNKAIYTLRDSNRSIEAQV